MEWWIVQKKQVVLEVIVLKIIIVQKVGKNDSDGAIAKLYVIPQDIKDLLALRGPLYVSW